jgi:dihydrofolate reductase
MLNHIHPFSAIVAYDKNQVIGKNNRLPWHLPADLKHFRALTLRKAIVMGKKTWQSIGRVLPERTNIVLSRTLTPELVDPNVILIQEFEQINPFLMRYPEVMIIGGAQLYQTTLPYLHTLYVTEIQAEFEGDTYFPDWNKKEWQLIDCEKHNADELNLYPYHFQKWQRD